MESDCSGTTAAAAVNNQLQQSEVFQKAEDYIGNANTFLSIMSGNQQWNQLEWGATVTDTQCVMLRLVLNEVFIHCETGNRVVGVQLSQSDDVVSYDTANYGSALNVFITNVQGGANGFVYLDLGNTTIFNENFHSQLLIHEIGHSLKLKHPFQGGALTNDGCAVLPTFAGPMTETEMERQMLPGLVVGTCQMS